jgi:hypothetical protein
MTFRDPAGFAPSHAILLLAFCTACAPVRTYGKTQVLTARCLAAGELRRGEEPNSAAGTPVPVTPADSVERPRETAGEIRCNGGLSR